MGNVSTVQVGGGNQPSTSILRGGRPQIVTFVVTSTSTPASLIQLVTGIGNAFIVIDSPVELSIQTDYAGGPFLYRSGEGEAYSAPTGKIFVTLTSNFVSANYVGAITIRVKIWVGNKAGYGFISDRYNTPLGEQEGIYSIGTSAPFSIAAGANGISTGVIQIPPATVNPSNFGGNITITGVMIGNLDASNTIFYSSSGNGAIDLPLFPQQVYRIPYAATLSINNLNFGFVNTNATAVNITLSLIYRVSGPVYETQA